MQSSEHIPFPVPLPLDFGVRLSCFGIERLVEQVLVTRYLGTSRRGCLDLKSGILELEVNNRFFLKKKSTHFCEIVTEI